MNRLQIRDLLVQRMNNVWTHPEVPVYYVRQQDSIDLETIAAQGVVFFLRFVVKFQYNEQASVGPEPLSRLHGTLELMMFAKEGASERDKLGYLDELTELFKFKALGAGLHTEAPTPGRSEEHDGWCSEVLRVPFFADSNT